MNVPGNAGRVDQSQTLPFAVDADIVNPEEGYLNGAKVTVQAIDQDNYVGIQVSTKKFEELPESTRPVKVAFKDFRKWLRNCRPVKALEHLLMGKGKRMLKKQNWGPISNKQAEAALKDTKDPSQREVLATKIKQFNTDLRQLDQKKMDHNRFKIENDEFRGKYKTILAIADGDLTSARIDLHEGLLIVLPPATPDGDPQCVRLDSKSLRVRTDAANKLAEIFKNSDAYKQYDTSKDRVYKLETERKELKTSLANQATELKKDHKSLIKSRVKDDKVRLADEYEKQKKRASFEMKSTEVQYASVMDGKIQDKSSEIDALRKEIAGYKEAIQAKEGDVAEDQATVKRNEQALEFAKSGEDLLDPDMRSILNDEGIEGIRKNKEALIEVIEANQQELTSLYPKLKEAQVKYKQVLNDEKALHAEKDKELTALGKDRKKVEKQYDDLSVKMSKAIDKDARTERNAAAKMFSGSGSKEKAAARKASNQPKSEQPENEAVYMDDQEVVDHIRRGQEELADRAAQIAKPKKEEIDLTDARMKLAGLAHKEAEDAKVSEGFDQLAASGVADQKEKRAGEWKKTAGQGVSEEDIAIIEETIAEGSNPVSSDDEAAQPQEVKRPGVRKRLRKKVGKKVRKLKDNARKLPSKIGLTKKPASGKVDGVQDPGLEGEDFLARIDEGIAEREQELAAFRQEKVQSNGDDLNPKA